MIETKGRVMRTPAPKYNPGFLTDDELVTSFCVRTNEVESIIETLSESTGNSNPHMIVVGPRGSGKTHLLLRVAVEIRRNSKLARFFPVVFAEESYEVTTCGEFWLECLGRLADQAPHADGVDLHRTYEDLRSSPDDRILAERCLGVLLDFADRHSQRLVLMVENLNMLFADMLDPDAGWRLRKTFQTEPRIFFLGSATSRFEEIDHPESALYAFFRMITLHALDTSECAALWQTVSGESAASRTIRALQILTGGSPRLLTIVARFGGGQSLRELMVNLLDLVDDHTEYFKSHLDSLPVQERRVYLALARLWKPAATKEIADLSRLDTNRCSALLRRLVQRGAVIIKGGTARRRQYYVAERLYNIYYLLRRGAGVSSTVETLIQFMVSYYSPVELRDAGEAFAAEAGVTYRRRRDVARFKIGPPSDLLGPDSDSKDPPGRVGIVGENEVSTLLACLPAMHSLPEGCVSVFIQFAAVAGPARALDLIQESLSANRLLPLVTALEQMLGRSPQVAREVEEIAADIRMELAETMTPA